MKLLESSLSSSVGTLLPDHCPDRVEFLTHASGWHPAKINYQNENQRLSLRRQTNNDANVLKQKISAKLFQLKFKVFLSNK